MPLLSDSAEPVARLQGAISDESAQARARDSMVVTQIIARGVRDARTLQAMRDVPRHLFVPPALLKQSYEDHPLPIGHGQTISQPYIVAFMTEALGLKGGETVLEVGAGSGYQSAVLSRIAARVFGIEIVEPLAREARERMVALGYGNVEIRAGDGYAGWPEHAPFDAILVAAAAPRVPEPLKRQLKDGGRLILPVGEHVQELRIVTRRGESFEERSVLAVQFVPMTGEIRRK
ncbi:MAG: protein-L-isoaspartate(D-aspartate) O-methyltransferase [Vicinamibacteria bacterium]|nr:protein-L-isoaspartate(D-aspartate) O-methyltransferase [Vicinamibacteria bacterium]